MYTYNVCEHTYVCWPEPMWNLANIHVADICSFCLLSHLSPLDAEALFEMNTKFGYILIHQVNASSFLTWEKGIVGKIRNGCSDHLRLSEPFLVSDPWSWLLSHKHMSFAFYWNSVGVLEFILFGFCALHRIVGHTPFHRNGHFHFELSITFVSPTFKMPLSQFLQLLK